MIYTCTAPGSTLTALSLSNACVYLVSKFNYETSDSSPVICGTLSQFTKFHLFAIRSLYFLNNDYSSSQHLLYPVLQYAIINTIFDTLECIPDLIM